MMKNDFPALSVLPTKLPPISRIKLVVSKRDCNVKQCEVVMNQGIFFDGTNNNMDRDALNLSSTNIARLHDQYIDRKKDGYHKVYVPGVGTKFPDIGEDDESALGSGCAFGCEGRVIFGILAVMNSLHRQCFKSELFTPDAILALCRNGSYVKFKSDLVNLAKYGENSGLLEPEVGAGNRRAFLIRQCGILQEKMTATKIRVVECFIDVFGFSRGAAEARVFCSWLNELIIDGRLAGVPLRFRFLGIVDTVASAGFWSGTIALATKSTGGHGAWASAEALRIPPLVENCVHMVAMHELRRNFPLDVIETDGKMQDGWSQYAYPGSHSDVGGGYRPGELGLAVGDDSQKLSQIPLNHMLECAIAAGVPLIRTRSAPGVYDPFAIHPDLAKAFDDFISQATLNPRPVHEWLQPYLNWRWQIRDRFRSTNQVKRASQSDKEILISFNESLIEDANAMLQFGEGRSFSQLTLTAVKTIFQSRQKYEMSRIRALEPEAQSVLALARTSRPTPPSFAKLFDDYVHDSLAGFNSPLLEGPGYWRYRRAFLGTDDHIIAVNQDGDTVRSVA